MQVLVISECVFEQAKLTYQNWEWGEPNFRHWEDSKVPSQHHQANPSDFLKLYIREMVFWRTNFTSRFDNNFTSRFPNHG